MIGKFFSVVKIYDNMKATRFLENTGSDVVEGASSIWNSKTTHVILMGLVIVFLICIVVSLFMKSGSLHLRTSHEEHFLSGAPVKYQLFYAPWCGHCKAVKPAWDDMCGSWNRHKDVEFIKHNCDDASGKAMCSAKKVRGYPTIILSIGDKDIEFSGARSKEGLTKFLETHLTNNGYQLD